MPDTKRFTLTAEQAHGLIDAANRNTQPLAQMAHAVIKSHGGAQFRVEIVPNNAMLQFGIIETSPMPILVHLYPARARKYLADHGIEEDKPLTD